jgi:hypothetical protein
VWLSFLARKPPVQSFCLYIYPDACVGCGMAKFLTEFHALPGTSYRDLLYDCAGVAGEMIAT